MNLKAICSFVFFLCVATALIAQNPQPAWKNYTTDQGLASPEVYVALQDSKGYMWFGTDNGLSRFDGYTFRNYGPDDGLLNNVVFDLGEDKQGRIWIMTQSANVYFYQHDSIFPFPFNEAIRHYKNRFRQGHQVYFEEADSSLYVTLSHLGILQIKSDGTQKLWKSQHPLGMVILKAGQSALFSYSENLDSAFYTFKGQLKERLKIEPLEWHKDSVLSFFPNDYGSSNFQLGSACLLQNGDLLFEYSDGVGLIQDSQIKWNQPFHADVTNFYEDRRHQIFLCLNHGKGFERYQNIDALLRAKGQKYLPGISAVNMAEDKEGGYWFTTLEQGVFYTPDFDFLIYDEKSGLPNSYIAAIEEKDDSTLFVGLRNGEIFELNKKNHRLKKLPGLIRNNRYQKTIYYDKPEQVLLAGQTLQYFNDNHWTLLQFEDEYGHVGHPDPVAIVPSRDGFFWVAGRVGIYKIDKKNRHHITCLNFNNSKVSIYCAYGDFQGQLWLGRIDGLWKLEQEKLIRPDVPYPAFYRRVEAICQLPDSTFILGTKGHGIHFWKGKIFSEIRKSDGLTSDMIENIYVDKNGIIWVGTLQGLNKISRKGDGTFKIENITAHHGLPSNEINEVEVIGNEVWVATTRGLVRFPYHHIVNPLSRPPVIIRFIAGQKEFDLHTKPSINYNENNVTLHFLAFNYRMQGKIPYRFRVDAGDWTSTMNTSVNFPFLPAGERQFEVQAQNENGVWSDSAILDFYIAPPWWRTWWAVTLAVLIFFITSLVIYKYRTHQLKKELTLQKQLVYVERQALRAQMNPHFIFNSLNAIQSYILQGDKAAAGRYLSRFAKLIRAALQHSRLTKIPLEDDIRSLENYLELEQLRFQGSFDFKTEVADKIDVANVMIPPMLVQPFVENAIVHGLSNKQDKGHISIDYRLDGEALVVTVTDNGIGIEESQKRKAELSAHKSIGLTVTKRRLEMLAGKGEIGRMKIEELKDDQGRTEGTRASIWIPLTDD